jgi:hypothetical protein
MCKKAGFGRAGGAGDTLLLASVQRKSRSAVQAYPPYNESSRTRLTNGWSARLMKSGGGGEPVGVVGSHNSKKRRAGSMRSAF